MNVVAITACTSGVAHTYMAAELLVQLAKKKNFSVYVETQGALGVENRLTEQQIDQADIVLFITDILIEGEERFNHHRIIKTSVVNFIRDQEPILHTMQRIKTLPQDTLLEI